jgi:hypothetical protein
LEISNRREDRGVMKKALIIIMILMVLSCAHAVRKDVSEDTPVVTDRELWRMHRDVRSISFLYDNGEVREGVLLRWEPDSILIQPPGRVQPAKIPATGIRALSVKVGNRIWESLALGSVVGGVYVAAVKSYDFSDASVTDAIFKLLGPPVIVFGSIAIGSGMDKHIMYRVPEEFEFDYDKANSLYKLLE